jgi:hypothetical protein
MYLQKELRMSSSLKTNIIAILIFSTLICANHAVAKDCYETSPNLINSNDAYYDLDKTKTLTNEEKNQVNNLFRKISGQWKGSATYTECKGPDNAPRTTARNATLTLKAKQTSTSSLTIHAIKKYAQERVKRSDNLTLLGSSSIFGFGFIDDNHLIFSEKHRRMSKNQKPKITKDMASSNTETIINKSGDNTKAVKDSVYQVANTGKNKISRITETIYDISLNANRLTFTRSYYTNGVYTGEELWVMYQ